MDTSLDPQEATRLIESSGQIHMRAFQVAIGVLTGLALCCFIGRLAVRLTYQKRLHLDDAFLIIAAASLCAATGILYHICYFLYLHSVALLAPQLLPYLLANYDELLNLQKRVYPFLALIWTTTFAVKGCFLAFMRPLVWHISRRVNWYYWFIAGFCILSWAFVVSEPFIVCPYFGLEGMKCFNSTVDEKKTLGLTALVTVLDILSDIMGSFLSRSTKLGLAIFLCLSIFMAICAIVKMAGFYYKGLEDDTWEFFWQHIEGAVSVMMASITAFRTLFVKQANSTDDTIPRSPVESLFHKLFRRFQSLARAQPNEKSTSNPDTSILKLPKIPSPIFTDLRTFIRRNNRTGVSSATFATLDSVGDASEADYHAALKIQHRADSDNSLPHDQPLGTA
ncbi:hypothetical protein F4813DRAFT_379749 [Daldinia decipiens]|uniref:uncharacterized protein n=1 Tax=Daldinia decipiens TaxID=326647 RepID=UPI0020C37EAD|nr:uncharacterized protein F4813DRAFT_379749 [Daldinia decipiens]KAI1659421.1 hypothetical protein F4813DRAFT_379749 [Daldinia decipiens]